MRNIGDMMKKIYVGDDNSDDDDEGEGDMIMVVSDEDGAEQNEKR